MSDICIYFQVHQPNRLKKYTFFEVGSDHFYEDDVLNKEVLQKVATKCYLPANQMMLDLINKHQGNFKISYSLSGVFLEQLEHHQKDVLDSFKALAETGCVEFLGETFYHSLAYVFSKNEFKKQVESHVERIEQHFGQKPKVFRNTELVYYNEMAKFIEDMGFKGILTEAVDYFTQGRTPDQLYKSPISDIPVFLRNYKLSDDIAFRFNNDKWEEYPLTPEKYANWLAQEGGDIVNLFMDYETIGEHNWEDSGIFDFWKRLPELVLEKGMNFKTPSEIIESHEIKDVYDVHTPISWADTERDLSAWKGNTMQIEALDKIYGLEKAVLQSKNPDVIHVWRKLQTSDHFYYMCTKFFNDGAVHEYFSPYASPYDGYIYFMNALSDLEITLEKEGIVLFQD